MRRTRALGAALLLGITASTTQAASRLPDGFEDTPVVDGLASPTGFTFAPDGRILITEQDGQLRVVEAGLLNPIPFLSVPVDSSVERGLLGVALAPDFATSGHVFVVYTYAEGPRNRVSRFTVSRADPSVADPASEMVILDGIPSSPFHNGGALRFLPDGTLLVAVGDGEDPASAQSLGALTGKLLRIGPAGDVPPDNPFAGDPNARGEIWAYGLRNPFSFAIEPGSGKVHINDVGVARIEEVDLGVPGGNYGWPMCEGPCDNPDTLQPLYAYNHSQGCAVTGAAFSASLGFPQEFGGYYFSDFCGRWIRRLTPEGLVVDFARDMDSDAVFLEPGPDGALYYLSYEAGVLRRIAYVGDGNRSPSARAAVSPEMGPAPLNVTLSADGSADPDGDPLAFTWDFGDGNPAVSGQTVPHTYTSPGVYVAKVGVEDGRGGSATAATRVYVGDPPEVSIASPLASQRFTPGQIITFSGAALDPETGQIPGDRLVWVIKLHHHPEDDPLHHTHPYLGPVFGPSGTVQMPEHLHAPDIFFRFILTATDPDGLPGTAFVDVHPDPSAF